MMPFYQKTIFESFLRYLRRGLPISVLAAFMGFYLTLTAEAQISLSNGTPVTQDFNGVGAGLPANWRLTNAFTINTNNTTAIGNSVLNFAAVSGVVNGMNIGGPAASNIPAGATVSSFTGTTVTMSTAATAIVPNAAVVCFSNGGSPSWANTANVTSANATESVGNATGRSYAYTSSVTNDRAFGFQASTSFITPHSVMAHYRNTAAATLTGLTVNFTVERYRINTAAASVSFFYSTDGSTWIPVASGDIATGVFATGTAAYTFDNATQTKVTRNATITSLSIPQNGDIYLRWSFGLANANSQGLALDDISVTADYPPCVAPANSPTALTFPSVGTGQISGSFTAATGSPTGYLVVRYPNGATPTNPTDATVYTIGASLGLGTVVSVGPATSFSATGLTISTSYDFYIYSFNNSGCLGGPAYRTTSPLFGTQTTNGCPSFASTININVAGPQVDGSVYTSLTNALNELSGCPISQPTVIQLLSNYVSTGETYPIKLGLISGASSTNTITIRPAAGATGLTITGNSAGAPILDLDGGRWWRVDGRPGGVGSAKELTISNTDNVNTLGGSVAIRHINGAQNNIIRFCNVQSSNKALVGGVINFGQGTLTDGNSNNTVTNCDISASTGGLPHTGISSVGVNAPNLNNTISNNNIFDFFNVAGNSYGIYISDNNENWTISGNSIYQTAARTLTGGAANRIFSGIGFSPSVFSTVNGMTISGNFIGGTAPNCGGTPLTLADNGTATLLVRAIFIQAGTTSPTSIQGNTIQNMAISSSSTSNNQSLISAASGSFNIGNVSGNILGSGTGTGSVTFAQTNGGTARFSGIIAGTGTGLGNMTIANNVIGSISVSGTANVNLAGIYTQDAVPTYTITGNQIGGSTSGSISNTSGTNPDTWGVFASSTTVNNNISNNIIQNISSGTGRMLGIRTDAGINNISGNTIRNCTSASTAATGCIGIWAGSTTAGQTISANTIHSLSSTDAAAATAIHGIYYSGPTSGSNVIERNFIHSFGLATSNTAGNLYGIRVLVGVFPVDIQNNMIRLGIDAAGNSLTTGFAIFGIGNASTGTTNHYFNTVFIGGTGVSGTTSSTYALFASGAGNTRSFLNNILVNARDGGATGNHYGFQVGGVGPNPLGLTMNYNLYQATGSNGFAGFYATNLVDEAAIIAAVGQNANSVICDPQLINPTGNANTVDLHIQAPPVKTLIEANGVVVAGVTIDFDGQTRSALTPTDIGADAGNFAFQAGGCVTVLTWNGSVNNVWANASNWSPAQVPSATAQVVIPGVPTQPALSAPATVLGVSLQANSALQINAGGVLNIKGDVSGVASGSIQGLGKVAFNGIGQQNVSGTFKVSNVDIANTSAQGVVIGNNATLRVEPSAATGSGIITFFNNSRLTINGKFVVGSNNIGTAKIGPMPATSFITGDVTIERYLPYTTESGQWYFLGSAISGKNFTDYADDFRVSGLTSGFGQQGGDILPSDEPERSTIFKYNELTHNLRQDTVQKDGWEIPGNENVIPGRGYRIYVNSYSNASHKVDNVGTFVQGDFTFPAITRTHLSGCVPVTFPCNEIGLRGWNLLANPYPCDIDWDATGGAWTKPAQMNNAFYTWNAAAGGYRVYLGTTGTPGVSIGTTTASSNVPPNIIPSSQAFFVNVTSPGSFSLAVKESAKVTSASGVFTRTAVAGPEQLRIRMRKDNSEIRFDAVLRLLDNATDGFDQNLDVVNFPSGLFYLTIGNADNEALILNSIAPVVETKTIPLQTTYAGGYGVFTLEFSELDGLLENYTLFLKDQLNGTIQPIVAGTGYTYSVSAQDGLISNRFELIISPNAVTSVSTQKSGTSMSILPNPSQSLEEATLVLNGFEGSSLTLSIIDAMGREVWSKDLSNQSNALTQIAINRHMAPGIYTVKVSGSTKNSTLKWVVK